MFSLLTLLLSISVLFGPLHAAGAAGAEVEPPKQVRLGYFANVTHAQAILGVESGEFAQAVAPAKFSTRTFNAGPSLVEALFSGEIDIGYVGPSPASNAFMQSRGKGLKVIAGAAADGVVIVARAGSGIERMEDLKGKRIATPQLGNTQDISARHYLMKVLGEPRADNIIPVSNAEQVSMMARGQIDAAWVVEPWGARLVADAGGKIVGQERDLWPGEGESPRFVLTLIVVSPEFLEKHADVVEKLLRVHRSWTARLRADAPAQVPMLATGIEHATGKKLSEAVIAAAVSRVRFTDDPLRPSIRTFAQWAVDLGLAKGVPDVNAMVDTTILDRLARAEAKPRPPEPGDSRDDAAPKP